MAATTVIVAHHLTGTLAELAVGLADGFTIRAAVHFTNHYAHGMSPVNVKLDDRDVARLDEAVVRGLAANRSDAVRIALRRQLLEWDRQAWDDAWSCAVPDEADEFVDLNARAVGGWADLDGDG